jgi:hypothetical protein
MKLAEKPFSKIAKCTPQVRRWIGENERLNLPIWHRTCRVELVQKAHPEAPIQCRRCGTPLAIGF